MNSSFNSFFSHEVTYLQVLGIRMWIFWGHYSAYHRFFFCVYVVPSSIPSYIEVICLHIFHSSYLSQTVQGQALCLFHL